MPATNINHPTNLRPKKRAQKAPNLKSPPPKAMFNIIGITNINKIRTTAYKSNKLRLFSNHFKASKTAIEGNIILSGIILILASMYEIHTLTAIKNTNEYVLFAL